MKKIDFGNIQKDFTKTLSLLEQKLRNDSSLRHWKRNTNRVVILNYFQVAKTYFDTLILICEYNTKLSISSPPITRAILENLFTIIYLFDDLDDRVFSFAKIIHRERKREIKEHKSFGYSTDKDQEFNESWEEYLNSTYSDLLPPNNDWENNNERFLSPSCIVNSFKERSNKTFDFLDFINKRHYRVLSIDSHTEPWRIAKLTRILSNPDDEDLVIFKNVQIWLGFISILAIASEIEININYGIAEKLGKFWIQFSKYSNPANEIYERRYKDYFN